MRRVLELPHEVTDLILQKLQYPELQSALLVCKEWKAMVLKMMKDRLEPCLKVSKYELCHGKWTCNGTKALVDDKWRGFPAESLWKQLGKTPPRLLHVCTACNGKNLLYLQVVCLEKVWTMVLWSSAWHRPAMKHLPLRAAFSFLDLSRVILWTDSTDASCSSYKVLLFHGPAGNPCSNVEVYDPGIDQWATIPTPGYDDFICSHVKGDLCYAITKKEKKLVSYDFRLGGGFHEIHAFPACSTYWLTELQGQLLLVKEVRKGLIVFAMEVNSSLVSLMELDQIKISFKRGHGLVACVDVKSVNDKLYISLCNSYLGMEWRILEWSFGVTKVVLCNNSLGLLDYKLW